MAAEENFVAWYESAWIDVYRRGESEGLDSLSEEDRVLFLAGYVIDRLAGGGVEMLYANPSGAYATRMVDALTKIGATKAAQVLSEINQMFPGGEPARDDEVRERQMAKLPRKVRAKERELERLFDEWMPNDGERVMLTQLYRYCHP